MSLVWFLLLLFLVLPTSVYSQALKGCNSSCGGVDIPYPFGMGDVRCAKNNSFLVDCRIHSSGGRKPYLVDDSFEEGMEIVSVNLNLSEVSLSSNVSSQCFNGSMVQNRRNLSGTPFTFSKRNKFIVVGCAKTAFLSEDIIATGSTLTLDQAKDARPSAQNIGCSSICTSKLQLVRNNICDGIGCCQTSINKGLKIYNVYWVTDNGLSGIASSNPCGRAFLVEENTFHFNTSFITKKDDLPLHANMVLDFAVDVCSNNTNQTDGACSCLSGYDGNPYIPDGCKDVDECKQGKNPCPKDCVNTQGSYICTDKSRRLIAIISGLCGGIFIMLLSGCSVLLYKKSKKIQTKKLRKKFFNQNYLMLTQILISSSHEDTTENTKFFTLKELEKATNNFNKARIIGEGGHGKVYKGLLLDQRVAAIKTSKKMDQRERKEFINEVALLSRTYHRNVVKLLGCCFESEMPLLVYEFISHGTLSDHLHVPDHSSKLCWEDRLRISIEVASAIVYLLSASSNTIFHRDLKSANILLDEKLTVKLSDFGASKSISSDQIDITATVQGTFGYLDPEYYQTGKLNEKVDVYSFGAILVELLTGMKPFSKDTSMEEGSAISHFIKLLGEKKVDHIFDRSIVKDSVVEEMQVVARLAGDCLKIRGDDRPTMKEIESTLEGIRRSKNKKTKGKINQDEEQLRLFSNEIKMVSDGELWSSSATNNSLGTFSTSKSYIR